MSISRGKQREIINVTEKSTDGIVLGETKRKYEENDKDLGGRVTNIFIADGNLKHRITTVKTKMITSGSGFVSQQIIIIAFLFFPILFLQKKSTFIRFTAHNGDPQMKRNTDSLHNSWREDSTHQTMIYGNG